MTPDRWKRIRETLEEALERQFEERERFLDELGASDPELKNEVDSLIALEADAQGYLETPPIVGVEPLEMASGEVVHLSPSDAHQTIGPSLSHYEILEKLGSGGMGDVYRARDGKLGRDVAIKVLPEGFSRDEDHLVRVERLRRFEREAKLLASLTHPNVATLHGFEKHDATHFLIMELVEGEDLAERISRGPIPVEEARSLLLQIAEGLEAAHEKGIVHRDLKPTNIKVSKDGRVKLLDFGVAKTTVQAPRGLDPNSPGTTTNGQVMGTFAYMSPEQARGEEVDKRSDIWAFGCILYELLTGRPAFRRESFSETVAAVLTEEPDWTRVPEDVPRELKQLLQRCLVRESRNRLRDIGDARILLWKSSVEEDQGGPARGGARRTLRKALPWSLAVLAAACTAWILWSPPGKTSFTPTHLSVALPSDASLVLSPLGLKAVLSGVALSPLGDGIVYSGYRDGVPVLYHREFSDYESTVLEGTEWASYPFFSPDGTRLGYGRDGKLMSLTLSSGVAGAVGNVLHMVGASWGPDDTIVFAAGYSGGLFRIPARGGTQEPVTFPDTEAGETSHRWPQVLPGGTHVLFTVKTSDMASFDGGKVAIASLENGEHRVLLEGASAARYVGTGHILYGREGRLFAVPLDLTRLETRGDPIAVLDNVTTYPINGMAWFDVSRDGTLAYVPGRVFTDDSQMVWIDRRNGRRAIFEDPGEYFWPRLSPNGKKIALVVAAAVNKIWVYDIERGSMVRLTNGAGNEGNPQWSPDGRWILFTSDHGEPGAGLLRIRADGGGPAEIVETVHPGWSLMYVSPSRIMTLHRLNSSTGHDVWVVPVDEGGLPVSEEKPLLETRFDEMEAVASPDGEWIAYSSDESGERCVYLTRYPGPGPKALVAPGRAPLWRHDGGELFFWEGDHLYAVTVAHEDGEPQIGSPRLIFVHDSHAFTGYDVTPDGQRFVVIEADLGPPVTDLRIILDWLPTLETLPGQGVRKK